MTSSPRLQRLALDDMDQVAAVHRIAFDARLPWLAGRYTPDQDRAFFRGHVFPACTLWGAVADGALRGFIAFRPGWVDHLYVLPDSHRRGIGAALLGVAKAESDELQLWTFRRNAGARRFYEAQGFAAAEETDGSRNEEREPDVRYRWVRGAGAA